MRCATCNCNLYNSGLKVGGRIYCEDCYGKACRAYICHAFTPKLAIMTPYERGLADMAQAILDLDFGCEETPEEMVERLRK